MKKTYIIPTTIISIVFSMPTIMLTSRYTSDNGEDYNKVKEDDDDEEPTVKSKRNAWNTWDEE